MQSPRFVECSVDSVITPTSVSDSWHLKLDTLTHDTLCRTHSGSRFASYAPIVARLCSRIAHGCLHRACSSQNLLAQVIPRVFAMTAECKECRSDRQRFGGRLPSWHLRQLHRKRWSRPSVGGSTAYNQAASRPVPAPMSRTRAGASGSVGMSQA
jgi:hypothetical protein